MKHALVILCGGNSVRMGTDKALLPFGDSCLIEYLVREFSPYFSNIYLSVKRKGAYAHLNLDVTEIVAIQYARTHGVPFLGLCLGMQLTIVEYA